jgi:hypothetical protein
MRQSDMHTCPMVEAHYHTNSQGRVLEKLHWEKDVGPTCGFTASPEVGPGATIGTLHTGFPRVHASGQDKRHGMHPHATTCHHGTGTCYVSKAQDPSPPPRRALALPCAQRLRTPTPSRRGLALPRVPQHRTPFRCYEGIQQRHASFGFGPHPPQWWDPVLSHVPWLSMGHGP